MHYRIGATFELVPAWLLFLETRGLVDAGRREQTLRELSDLHSQLLKIWENQMVDPALLEGMRGWPLPGASALPPGVNSKSS
jgi:hypothetical protein